MATLTTARLAQFWTADRLTFRKREDDLLFCMSFISMLIFLVVPSGGFNCRTTSRFNFCEFRALAGHCKFGTRIKQLRQFIDAGFPQQLTHVRNPRIIL